MRTETIQYVPHGRRNRDGDPIATLAAPVDIAGCKIWPRFEQDFNGGREALDGQNVLMPDNATTRAMASQDSVIIRGDSHIVDGNTQLFVGKGVIIRTKRVRTG